MMIMRLNNSAFLWILISVFCVRLSAQSDMPDFEKLATKSLPVLQEFLAIPNDAHMSDDIELNVLWCEKAFSKLRFKTKRLNTPTVPLLLAERKVDNPRAKTVLVYLQIDGQPVDPNHWFQDNPYGAVAKQKSIDGD